VHGIAKGAPNQSGPLDDPAFTKPPNSPYNYKFGKTSHLKSIYDRL
jgi:hypothetical protein